MSATASSSRSTRTRRGGGGEDVGSGGTDEKQEGVEQYEEEWDAWSANDDGEPAEPVKKKARKATQSKGKGKSKVSKKNEGKLAPLLDLPVEIFTEVAGHLDPLTLLHLSRTSKAFHQLFASRSSKGIWQAARSTVHLPDLEADDLTEMAYAAFMFEKVCSVCEKDRAGIVNFDLRLRFCKGCQKANLNPEHYFSIVFPNLVVHPRTLECCLRTQKSHNPNGFDWYFMPEVFAVNAALFNVQAAIDDEDELPEVRESLAAEMAEFIAKRKARVTATQSDARILEDLASASAVEREKAVQEAKRQRREAIIAKLEELGYDKRDLDVWDPAVRKIVVQARPLTDLSWQRMSSDLIQHVEKNRDLRLDYEKTTRRFQAQFTLRPYYNSMLAAQTAIDDEASLPPLAEFIYLPAVAQFWLDDPPAELNDETWKEAGPAILREVKVEKEGLEAAEDVD